jgi:hypothetical protein
MRSTPDGIRDLAITIVTAIVLLETYDETRRV